MKRFDTTRPEFSSYGFTCERWTPTRMTRPDRHNEIELNLLTSGSLTYLLGGHRTTIDAGKLAIFWAAIPHQIVEVEGDSPYFVVTLPLSELLRAALDPTLVKRILQGELPIDGMQDELDAKTFRRWEQDLTSDERELERAARLEVQARLLRFAYSVTETPVATSMTNLSHADQLACYIARNYQQPLTSQSIAAANGVHANYAMTLFRKMFGTTMTAFIIQHRISHAQRLLITTDDAIVNVALSKASAGLTKHLKRIVAAHRENSANRIAQQIHVNRHPDNVMLERQRKTDSIVGLAHSIDGHCNQDYPAFDDLLPKRRNVQQHEAAVEYADNQTADDRS